MAFCSNCGAEIADGTKFCPSCGTAVNGQSVSAVADSNSRLLDKENSLKELSKIYEYFEKKRSVYDEWNYVNYTLSDYSENGKKKAARKFLFYYFIAGIMAIVAWVLISLLEKISNDIIFWIIMIPTILLLLLAFFLFFGGGIFLAIHKQKIRIRELTARQEVLRGELNEYYHNYGSCPIGIEYTFPKDIEYMIDIIRSGRAVKISDALNIMLDDYHKQTVEENVRIAVNNSAEALRNAREAAESASRAAASAKNAEWYSRR